MKDWEERIPTKPDRMTMEELRRHLAEQLAGQQAIPCMDTPAVPQALQDNAEE